MSKTRCEVIALEQLTKAVTKVLLKPLSPTSFKTGQYLQIVMGDNDRRPFSIASTADDDYIELHIGAEPGNSYAAEVLERMQQDRQIDAEIGKGNAWLRASTVKPIILLAGGTGFSYTYAILQQLLNSGFKPPIFLYWGTRQQQDLYLFNQLKQLESEHQNFTFVAVVEHPPTDWQGKTGWVHRAVLEDFVSLDPYQVYIAGRFEMAGVARQDFCEQGLHPENLFGDAYEFI